MALAKVVRGGGGSRLEASTVLTVMVRTRTSLRVEHDCRWCGLAISPRIIRRALTLVIVYAVDASSTVLTRGTKEFYCLEVKSGWSKEGTEYLAHMINAVIQVGGAIKPREADWAFAAIVGPVVDAPAPVLAGVVPFCAKGYLLLAVLAHESWGALASVGLYEVDAG